MVTDYFAVSGELIGEATNGIREDYLVDSLGSVVATVSSDAVLTKELSYKPYGALLSSSGSGLIPRFSWVGSLGYQSTGLEYSDYYVRARHYSVDCGRWNSVDRLWPSESAYDYVGQNPTSEVDPSGLSCLKKIDPCGHKSDGTDEFWIRSRTTSQTYLNQVAGTAQTMLCCSTGDTNWYTLYVGTVADRNVWKGGTTTECGVKVSYLAHSTSTVNYKRGWQGFTAGGNKLIGFDVDGLGPNEIITIDMEIGPGGVNGACNIVTPLGIVSSHELIHKRAKEYAQFSFGGIIADKNDNSSGHSQMSWLSMAVNGRFYSGALPSFHPCNYCASEYQKGVMSAYRHPCTSPCGDCCNVCSWPRWSS